MEASKVSLRKETMHAATQPLDRSARRKLKVERVKDYIRAQPNGTPLSSKELVQAAGYNPAKSTGYAFISKMLRLGELVRSQDPESKQFSWHIPEEDKHLVTKPETLAAVEAEATDVRLVKNIEQLAKDYFWETSDDSLKGFVNALKNKEE